jgi:hypothetical protein
MPTICPTITLSPWIYSGAQSLGRAVLWILTQGEDDNSERS